MMRKINTRFPIKEHIVRVNHKNGTTYVEQRQYRYDPYKKRNTLLSSKRIGKIDPATDQIIPCRPKKKNTNSHIPLSATVETGVKAATEDVGGISFVSRMRTGASDILDWAGKASGLEKHVRRSFAEVPGRADKALSIARYWLMTGEPVNNISSWQLEHDLPYVHGMSPDICYDLFDDIGHDENGMHRLFTGLAHHGEEDSSVLAFDSTTVSGYSEELKPFLRYGFNKAGDNLPTYKLCTFYSINKRLPVAFDLQPGNISDVSSIKNAIIRVQSYGLKKPEFVIDNGFSTKGNFAEMLRNSIHFTARVTLTDKWVAKPMNEVGADGLTVREGLNHLNNICPFDSSVRAVSRTCMVEFSRKRERNYGDKEKGSVEIKKYRMYLHYFRNNNRVHIETEEFNKQLIAVRNRLEQYQNEDVLSEAEQAIAQKYLICSKVGRGGNLHVKINTEAVEHALRNIGIFCLASNKHKDPWAVLKRYRMRNIIEESYRVSKTDLDGDRARIWSESKVRGKELCRMIALGYHFYLQTAVRKVRDTAERLAQESTTQQQRNAYDGLRKWLDSITLRQLLSWFDCVESVTARNAYAKKRWTTETIRRDQLFLNMLRSQEVQTFTQEELHRMLPA